MIFNTNIFITSFNSVFYISDVSKHLESGDRDTKFELKSTIVRNNLQLPTSAASLHLLDAPNYLSQ